MMFREKIHTTGCSERKFLRIFTLKFAAGKGHDLVSLNVQRGRDHGLPSYNAFRQFFGLEPILSMDQRPDEIAQDAWDSFKLVYREPNDIDPFAGGIAETPIPGNESCSGTSLGVMGFHSCHRFFIFNELWKKIGQIKAIRS